MTKESLLFCASECYPFAKTGGLADIAHSFPQALQERYTPTVVLPLYSCINQQKYNIQPLEKTFSISMDGVEYLAELYGCTYEKIEYIFVYVDILSQKEFLYGTLSGDYQDNALRFALFSRVIVEILRNNTYSIAHLNDWQTALVPLLLEDEPLIDTKTLFTIHNLAYQGIFSYETLQSIGVDSKYFTSDILEFYGQINFMKGAIKYSDAITTVSQNYAKEIVTEKYGCGLEGFLECHKYKLTGIMNGIDSEHFSPLHDTLIEYPFQTLTEKKQNKKKYLKEKKLTKLTDPLFIFIGRFTEQKGLDLLIESLDFIATQKCNIAILGEGSSEYQEKLQKKADQSPNIYCDFTYNEKLSHEMYAACDFLVMPSLFEPCGLNQMITMSYGAIPIVHSVGGLKDSVHNYKKFDKLSSDGYGIVFDTFSLNAFKNALQQALALYATKREYNKIVKYNMLCDFSWKKSVQSYSKLYQEL